MTTLVRSTLADGVATLTVDRPQALNALNPALITEVAAALNACAVDERTRAIVLTGAGRAFSAGGDTGWFGEVLAGRRAHAQSEIAHCMETVGNPLNAGDRRPPGARGLCSQRPLRG
ncbi:enoyl-CoA hydratase/isomerase family protein [Variovorax humicola]|uniref:Enoyl-CoA hydratase/isomerase family protein n=1 Tax=Variovorax humicola TaxID=1769758 RepID=A0ABU8WAW3_9BURK